MGGWKMHHLYAFLIGDTSSFMVIFSIVMLVFGGVFAWNDLRECLEADAVLLEMPNRWIL